MPLAKAVARAMRKAIVNNAVGSAFTKPMAAVDAIKRFEGPKNGIKFSPKATRKVMMNSTVNSITLPVFPENNQVAPYKHKEIKRENLFQMKLMWQITNRKRKFSFLPTNYKGNNYHGCYYHNNDRKYDNIKR